MTMSASGSDCDVVIARLAAMMTDYATQLNGLLPAPPYTPPQVSQALMLIQNTRAAILSYLQQLERTSLAIASRPDVTACFAYHLQTLTQADNIYQAIGRSLNLPSVTPPNMPTVPPLDAQTMLGYLDPS
jgi:hypothetical protein